MLTRTGSGSFTAPTGASVRLIAKPQNNGGRSFATFRYGDEDLPTEDINGHPGCTFTVEPGKTMFGCTVTFGAGPSARYDLFEVEEDDTEIDLEEEVTPDRGPLHQLVIRGAVSAVAASRAASKRPAAKRAAAPRSTGRKTAKKKTTTKKKTAPVRKVTAARATRTATKGRKTASSSRKSSSSAKAGSKTRRRS